MTTSFSDSEHAVPENLQALMAGDQSGYSMRTGYIMELMHGLMGFFPAIFKGTKRIIIVFDLELLKKVAVTLSPRRSKVTSNSFLVNFEHGIAYPILEDSESSKPQRFLSHEEFDRLLASDPYPFEWAPGLVGDDMSYEEFQRTLESALEHAS